MKTETMLAGENARHPDPLGALFEGTIFASEYARAGFAASSETAAVDAPEGTKQKTCKPTRSPCCRGDSGVEGTKEKTCKPTRNPCCRTEAPQPSEAPKAPVDLLLV